MQVSMEAHTTSCNYKSAVFSSEVTEVRVTNGVAKGAAWVDAAAIQPVPAVPGVSG
jgi:hypothetical protein